MTQRERRLALILGVFLAAGGLLLFWQLILRPLEEYDLTIAGLDRDVSTVRQQVSDTLDDKKKLERWQLMSLPVTPGHPSEVTLARDEYLKYVHKLLHDSKFADVTLTPMDTSRVIATQPGKKPVFIPVNFNVRARASLTSLVQMLQEFQRTPLLHKIKTLKIDRPEGTSAARKKREDVVTVEMTIEALVVTGADRRPTNLLGVDHRLVAVDALTVLEHGPAAVALVPAVLSPTGPLGKRLMELWTLAEAKKGRSGQKAKAMPEDDDYEEAVHRSYADIAKKNIFQGPPTVERMDVPPSTGEEIDVTKFTYLTDITFADWGGEAYIYFRASHRKMRLRVSPGYRSFAIKDDFDDQFAVKGEVMKIESRDLYFKVGNELYRMHIGQNFAEALRQRVPDAEAQALGLAVSSKKVVDDSDD
jgi:hypothetical protein